MPCRIWQKKSQGPTSWTIIVAEQGASNDAYYYSTSMILVEFADASSWCVYPILAVCGSSFARSLNGQVYLFQCWREYRIKPIDNGGYQHKQSLYDYFLFRGRREHTYVPSANRMTGEKNFAAQTRQHWPAMKLWRMHCIHLGRKYVGVESWTFLLLR